MLTFAIELDPLLCINPNQHTERDKLNESRHCLQMALEYIEYQNFGNHILWTIFNYYYYRKIIGLFYEKCTSQKFK